MILIKTYIFKRKHGRGKVSWRVRWKDQKTHLWKSVAGGQTQTEAKIIEAHVRQELLKGNDPSEASKSHLKTLTVEDVITRFFDHSRYLSGAERWQVDIRQRIESQVRPYWGKTPFSEISQDELFKFYLDLKSQDLCHATIDKYHRILCILGDIYAEMSGTQINPIRVFRDFRKRFPIQASTRDINFLTPEELELIYRQARRSKNPILFPLLKFLANTGLRRSEALELKWTDIDKANGLIHVRKSKTGRGRTIPLDPAAAEALQLLKRKSAYVFATNTGLRLRKDVYLQPLKRAVKRAGIKKRVDLHSLRHSFGSNKIRQGWGIKKVSLLLGHSNITITAKVYTHLLDGDLRVQDDFRFDVDKNKNSIDSKRIGGMDEKVSKVLAQVITNAALKTEGGEKLLSELLATLSRPEQKDLASFGEMAADFFQGAKKAECAPPMLQASSEKPPLSNLIEIQSKKKAQDFNALGDFLIGVPTGIRTPVTAVKGRCPRPLDDGDAFNASRNEEKTITRNVQDFQLVNHNSCFFVARPPWYIDCYL